MQLVRGEAKLMLQGGLTSLVHKGLIKQPPTGAIMSVFAPPTRQSSTISRILMPQNWHTLPHQRKEQVMISPVTQQWKKPFSCNQERHLWQGEWRERCPNQTPTADEIPLGQLDSRRRDCFKDDQLSNPHLQHALGRNREKVVLAPLLLIMDMHTIQNGALHHLWLEYFCRNIPQDHLQTWKFWIWHPPLLRTSCKASMPDDNIIDHIHQEKANWQQWSHQQARNNSPHGLSMEGFTHRNGYTNKYKDLRVPAHH